MQFAGKVVLITGASSGIGAATAEHLASLGASLALVGRNAENLRKAALACEAVQPTTIVPKPLAIIADVTTEADRIISETIDHYGRLDVLINNAGIGGPTTIQTATLYDFDSVMNTNVRGVFHLSQLAVPELIKTKGNIVNVSSLAGIRSIHTFLIYSMSKGALDQFTKCISLELAPLGVRVNSVNPAVIATNFHYTAGLDDEAYKQLMERCKETHPLGRAGQPEEVAAAIAFLASDSATFITGTLLPVDGGRCNSCPR